MALYDHNRLWYSHQNPPIEGVKEVWFYDDDFDFKKQVEQEYLAIKQELLEVLEKGGAEMDTSLNNQLASQKNTWQSFSFVFWDHVVSEHNCSLAPYTLKVLKNIPGMVSASVSVLQGQAHIRPHRGNTNAIYRCHLPLLVPAGLPEVGFYVGYQERPWEEGKLMVFNDAAYHKAWNNSHEPRVVLIFDIIRPVFLDQRVAICREVLSSFAGK